MTKKKRLKDKILYGTKIGNDRYEDGKEDFLLSKIKIKHLKGKSSEQIADELEESIDTINQYIKQLETK